MKKLKVLLFANYGLQTITDKTVKGMLTKNCKPKNRTGKIVELLEKQGEIISHQNGGYWIKTYDEFYFIAEVDTSRPWTILEYDGAEYVQYLDYSIIDKNLNYCEFSN